MDEHGAAVVRHEGGQTDGEDHVDEEILGEVLMLMEDESADGMFKACDLFRSGVPERFLDIDAALAEGRFEAAARASHSLRGSAGAFGARRLSLLGQQLEQLCREADGPYAVRVVEEMRAEYVIFQAILDGRLAELGH